MKPRDFGTASSVVTKMSGNNRRNVTSNPTQCSLASHQQIVVGDRPMPIMNIGGNLTVNTSSGEKSKNSSEKKLSAVVRDYKIFITKTENIALRTKMNQLQAGSNKYFLQRKLRREGSAGITISDLLMNISRTSLVSGPSGSGKSTLAVNITVEWAESDDDTYDLVLFLSSLHKKEKLPLHKLLWGEYASRMRKDTEEIYQEILERQGKILVIIDGLGIYKKLQPVDVSPITDSLSLPYCKTFDDHV